MYAVIQSGGKQYRVSPGEFIQIEKIPGEIGASVHFEQVLFYNFSEESVLEIGKPFVTGAQVTAQIVGQGRGEKVLIVKMKRRKQYRRTKGHRQEYTQVLITGLHTPQKSIDLSEVDKKSKLESFYSDLKPKVQQTA